MRTASLFTNGKNQAVRLPKEYEFKGVTEVEIIQDGDSLILRPKRQSWTSFADAAKTCDNYLSEREGLMAKDGARF
ncbi:MAG: AbrB/MazE/SpoVT family DNA-binding domain-containing protein [Algicola sp.]|nr:AbrB/MazE/SpoVT family DNA-binding domain-containing protein [Algicola sp.]